MNENIATRLSAAKQLYWDGDLVRRREDDAGRIQAAIMIDDSIELALKTVVKHHKLPTKGQLSFFKLVGLVATYVPSGSTFLEFRDVRNDAQHDGKPPRRQELDDMAVAAKVCLEEVFVTCGTTFERFTLRALVANAATTSCLDAAFAEIEASPSRAVASGNRGLKWVKHMATTLAGKAHRLDTFESYDPGTGIEWIARADDVNAPASAALLSTLVSVGLGFELPNEIRAAELVDAAGHDRVEEPDAWWFLDYVARHAYRLEQHLPRMQSMTFEETEPTYPHTSIVGRAYPAELLRRRRRGS